VVSGVVLFMDMDKRTEISSRILYAVLRFTASKLHETFLDGKRRNRYGKKVRKLARKKKPKNRYSTIKDHKRDGKTLLSPLANIPGVMLRSWSDECIPNIIWACVLSANLERSDCLQIFREVVIDARERLTKDEYNNSFITHNYLSLLSEEQFDKIFCRLLKKEEAKRLLSSLLLIESLPDLHHWRRHLQNPLPEEHFPVLAKAVNDCFFHQSQEATDVRWLKIMYFIVCGKMHFPTTFSDKLEEMRLYPEKGDMRSVRPTIRSLEMSVRPWEFGEEVGFEKLREGVGLAKKKDIPPKHNQLFWDELYRKTKCIYLDEIEPPSRPEDCQNEAIDIYDKLISHFHNTLKNTSVDPRHDASFGLALYALSLYMVVSSGCAHSSPEGRLVLRTIMEAFVILHYLRHTDNPSIWKKFRTDGIGKTKLAFLKNINSDELPAFFDAERIEQLANEDMWLELQDINIGSWSDTNLRNLAVESKVKETYDKYYDWASGFSHAQWMCVRDTVFSVCANPLHRFHRVPTVPRLSMPSILPDARKLINRILDDINSLYPVFKPRLKTEAKSKAD